MSFYKTHSQARLLNPMHSSQIISKQNTVTPQKLMNQPVKSSTNYTRASSEIGNFDYNQYSNLAENYQNRIKNMQMGFQRSKQQFQSSFKQLYREKIILLNIIGHNQELVDQFRSKIKISPQVNFKEIETKYNIIKSGLFHNELCPTCIMNISKADTQNSKFVQRESIKNPQRSNVKERKKNLNYTKQYSWMYVPSQEVKALVAKLKGENYKLKMNIEQIMQENMRKIAEKNKEIQQLRIQKDKETSVPVQRVIHLNLNKETISQNSQRIVKIREVTKPKMSIRDDYKLVNEANENLIQELNEKILLSQLQRLNLKYKNRYY